MRLDLWYGRPWALTPAKMDEIQAGVDALLAGHRLDFRAGPSGGGADDEVEVAGGVAVIPVYGTLDSKANLVGKGSGGTSYQLLARDLGRAAAAGDVDAIVLDIDSPGGSVNGLADAVAAVRAAAARKPVVAYTGGQLCSAAYWLASAATEIVAVETAQVGSIGVRLVHTDRSQADAQAGVRRTELYAGKYKTVGTDTRPLDEESRAYLQAHVDGLYTLFVEQVAAHRGLTVAQVLAAAEGQVYLADAARQARLVDRIGDLTMAHTRARRHVKMNRDQLRTEHPDLYQALLAEGAATVTVPDGAALRAEGAAAERARATALVETHGPLDLTLAALRDGTEPGAFALAVLAAERAGRAAAAERLVASLEPPVPPAPRERPEAAGEVVDFMAVARARAAADKSSLADAVRAVTAEQPALREAYAHDACRQTSRPRGT